MNLLPTLSLDYLLHTGQQQLLVGGLKGIEKESLRITTNGTIASTQHPHTLGAALTHPHITTDYSEALLEFITPPFADITKTLDFLRDIHIYTYSHLQDEILLASSMPCGINGDDSIQIAEYGNSNIGKMKHIYRQGLWHRYGRAMQVIAGVHFNYSVNEALWQALWQPNTAFQSRQDFISAAYFALIRNFQRQDWLLLYLFGASPCVCKSFFHSRPRLLAGLDFFDQHTLYRPFATSLRMSDIGYKNKNQANLAIDYNTLDAYIDSLNYATQTPQSAHQEIGVLVDGEYRQLNANILQIDNEYYSSIRPKQIAKTHEKPTLALRKRGVQYVEVRSLDLDLFNPAGIGANQARFVETFLLYCLLQPSPSYVGHEISTNNRNQLIVANNGRQPCVQLNKNGKQLPLQTWADEILQSMAPISKILDNGNPDAPYTCALRQQAKLVADPNLTPSARILATMTGKKQSFGDFSMDISLAAQQHFASQLPPAQTLQLDAVARTSHQSRLQIEANDKMPFADFLAAYFAQ